MLLTPSFRRYAGNYYYNIYNKKATNAIHAHWTVAFTQLVVGVVWSFCMWIPGIRKAPVLSNVRPNHRDLNRCTPHDARTLDVDAMLTTSPCKGKR